MKRGTAVARKRTFTITVIPAHPQGADRVAVVAYVVDEHGAVVKGACKGMTLPGESERTAVDQAIVSTALASKGRLPEGSYSMIHVNSSRARSRLKEAGVRVQFRQGNTLEDVYGPQAYRLAAKLALASSPAS